MIHTLIGSCNRAARLSSRAMEQPLTPAERLRLKMHLMMCKRCNNFSRQIQFLRRASSKLPEIFEKDEG